MTASQAPALSEYDAFAPYYDAFTAASDYEAWTTQVLALARRSGLRGSTLLDLACGTGKSFVPFATRGFRVTGCDASTAMLAEAARRAPGAALVHADLRRLPTLGRFDLVTCFDDSLNYLLSEDDLAAAFAGIEANLGAAGLAVFDLNSLLAYRTTFAAESVSERDGMVFAWRGSSTADAEPGCAAEALIDVFAPAGDGLYTRVTTRHAQRHFPRERVEALLAAAGLQCMAVHGVLEGCSLVEPADETHQPKLLYTARRREGGDARDDQEDREAGPSDTVHHEARLTQSRLGPALAGPSTPRR
jgi:SAM-dependent methyltransferase